MTDTQPTVWEAKEHTLAKHKILKTYLQAWIAILSRQAGRFRSNGELLYVDGFAGPGIYENGEPGSPILAIKVALEFDSSLSVPLRLQFIEDREDRFQRLCAEVDKRIFTLPPQSSIKVPHPLHGDCTRNLIRILDHKENNDEKLGPALIFLDQFGYSEVPMSLIARVMDHSQCEVLTYLNWDHLNRFITDESKWPGITNAFGTVEWKSALKLIGRERQKFLRELYKKSLCQIGNSKYVLEFAMANEHGSLLHWLFFCTNNLRGLEEMKRAMWRVDDSGSFQFTDARDPDQPLLLKGCDDEWLADELSQRLSGKTLSVKEIGVFVLTETPSYKYKTSLGMLENTERIEVVNAPAKRRKRTFPDESIKVRFLPSGRCS